MGVLSDVAIAKLAGCKAHTVGRERQQRGIASIGHSGTLPDLQSFDGQRARRHELGFTQAQVGARFGCTSHHIALNDLVATHCGQGFGFATVLKPLNR